MKAISFVFVVSLLFLGHTAPVSAVDSETTGTVVQVDAPEKIAGTVVKIDAPENILTLKDQKSGGIDKYYFEGKTIYSGNLKGLKDIKVGDALVLEYSTQWHMITIPLGNGMFGTGPAPHNYVSRVSPYTGK